MNMNIEINIETLLIGNYIYILIILIRKFWESSFFFIKQTKRCYTPSQQL